MTDDLTDLLHDTAQRVPTRLHRAADLRRNAQTHQRVRRTSAGALAVVLLAGAIGIATNHGGDRRAAPLPAEQPPISRASLLIPDEISPWFSLESWTATNTAEGEADEKLTWCQQNTFRELDPERVWRRDHKGRGSGFRTRQVTADFSSAAKARKAYDTIATWFDACANLEKPVHRYPPRDLPGGQAQTVRLALPTPVVSDEPNDRAYEVVGYGISGKAITVVTQNLVISPFFIEEGPTEGSSPADPLRNTMALALQRLAGALTSTENSVPRDFRFADEATQTNPIERSRDIAAGWQLDLCPSSGDPLRFTELDARRTGRLWLGSSPLLHQLALYTDEAAATAVADDLRNIIAQCSADSGEEVRTVETTVGTFATYVGFKPADAYDGTHAVAVVQVGRAVYLPAANFSGDQGKPSDSLKQQAVDAVSEAIGANVAQVCQLAGCSPSETRKPTSSPSADAPPAKRTQIPDAFRFTEEGSSRWQQQSDDTIESSTDTTKSWGLDPCAENDEPTMYAADKLRTSMRWVRLSAPELRETIMLALYPDRATAASVLRDMRAAVEKCGDKVQGGTRYLWSHQPHDVGEEGLLAVIQYEQDGRKVPGSSHHAVTLIGNAVLLKEVVGELFSPDNEAARDKVNNDLIASLRGNADEVCQLVECRN